MGLTFDDGHHAVVVGAAGDIGTATCRAYAAAGAFVTALDLDPGAAGRAIGSLGRSGARALRVDVTVAADVARLAREVAADRPVDSVVYAAGVAPTSDVLTFDWDSYRHTLAVNLDGALHVAQAFGIEMRDAGRGGSFAFLASVAGKRGEAGGTAYCASKFALLGAVECLAIELAPHGIRVNALCPGNVDSSMLRQVAEAEGARDGRDVAEVLASYAAAAAFRRLVSVEEVAAAAVWLASPWASGITGESINIDAGALTG